MVSFFFFSFQEDLLIDYMKITTKFDNNGEGYSRFSFKTWLQKRNLEELPKLYLLISNRENTVILEKIDESYNNYLAEKNFRKAAGIEDIIDIQEHEKCITGKIEKFEEDRNLRNRSKGTSRYTKRYYNE